MDSRSYLVGEKKYIEFEITSCEDETVIITDASYVLKKDGFIVVETGKAEVDDDEIRILLDTDKPGVFMLEVTVTIPPETIKRTCVIRVLES